MTGTAAPVEAPPVRAGVGSARTGRLAWLPVILLAAAIIVLAWTNPPGRFRSPWLTMVLSVLCRNVAALLVAYLAARTFLVRGSPRMLLIGCGVTIWGVASFATTALLGREANIGVTVSNLGFLLSGMCFLSGAILAAWRPDRAVREPGLWLGACYVLAVAAVALVIDGATGRRFPLFFVEGAGGTPLRHAVLATAGVMLALSAALQRFPRRTSSSSFWSWYAMALSLMVVSIFGMLVEPASATLLDWTARAAQYLSGIYLLIAAVTSVRESHTWRIPLERALEERTAELSATIASIPDGVIVFRPDGSIAFMNPAARRITGFGEAHLTGSIADRIGMLRAEKEDGTPYPVEETPGMRALRGETVEPVVMRVRSLDGSVRWLSSRAAPMRTSAGLCLGAVTVISDITERRQAEEALRHSEHRFRELAEELREADRRKSVFLATLSHELRNPLAPITHSVSILERAESGSEDARTAVAIIDRQLRQLARIVDDLLDVTRIASNKVRVQRERLEFNDLVRRTVEDHRALFESSGIALEFEAAPSPLPIQGDGNRLGQSVGNLLQNAVKFTSRGGRVGVSVSADPASNRAELRVADSGIGMRPEVLSRLFEPFMQADDSLDRSKGGLGLGLALVKGIVDLHGGEVTAQSAGLGRGSEFVIRLPLDLAAPPQPERRAGGPQIGRRVLIIEDVADAAESLRLLLAFLGHEVAIAHDGCAGIAKARELRPEVVLCDIGLPVMDGYEVARAFRSDRALSGAFLVALSGYALPEDLRRAADAGFDRHMAKPPDVEKLQDLLSEIPRDRRGQDDGAILDTWDSGRP